MFVNPLGANPTKWSSTLKQFVGNLATNCLSVFDHFVKLALKGLSSNISEEIFFNRSAWLNSMLLINDFGCAEVESKKFLRSISFRYIVANNLFFFLFLQIFLSKNSMLEF